MNKSVAAVLNRLRIAGNAGINVTQFPKGFRLGARIYDLRQMGYEIITRRLENGMAEYVLVGEPKASKC